MVNYAIRRRSQDVADLENDGDGDGSTRVLGPDTVARVRAWCAAAGITTGPLFRSVKYGRAGDRLPAGAGARIFKRLAARAGASVVEIQLAGGWKSPMMVARYAERLDLKKTARRLAAIQGRL